jgi:hypothetical protein
MTASRIAYLLAVCSYFLFRHGGVALAFATPPCMGQVITVKHQLVEQHVKVLHQFSVLRASALFYVVHSSTAPYEFIASWVAWDTNISADLLHSGVLTGNPEHITR